MPTSKKRVTGYIGSEIEADWAEYVAHLGVSESAALEWAIKSEIRRHKGENSKERMLAQHSADHEEIISLLRQMQQTLQLLQREKWTQIAAPDGKISLTISLDPNDMDRLLQAVKAR
jgi:hypothetical protein